MRLVEALQIDNGDVVVFVGAGGKTTTMFKLAHELSQGNRGVVVTTTTKIYPPTPAEIPCTLVEEDTIRLLAKLEEALRGCSPVAVAASLGSEGKLAGISGALVEAVSQMKDVDNVLVEGDGAARKPFKAPLDYEPIIPECATLVVPVVGVEVVGQRLTEEHVQRAERVAQLVGIAPGTIVSAEIVAEIMVHSQGNIKGSPESARIIPVINKVEEESRLKAAREIAHHLFARGAERVVIAHSAVNPPVVEVLAGPDGF